jgi:hypothetical protein
MLEYSAEQWNISHRHLKFQDRRGAQAEHTTTGGISANYVTVVAAQQERLRALHSLMDTLSSRGPAMAMRDITELMNTYRECSRNLWNVYFFGRENIGASLDAFAQIRKMLFNSLVVDDPMFMAGCHNPVISRIHGQRPQRRAR